MGDVLTQMNSLVEFSLEEVSGRTRVTLSESGFAAFGDTAEECFSGNNGGWDYMLDRLQKHMSPA